MSAYFDNDEAGYLRWVQRHRNDGFIVNLGGGFPPKLHRANQSCVTTAMRTHYTTHAYKKDCSTNKNELAVKYGQSLTYCKRCF